MLSGRRYRLAFTPEQAGMAEESGNICRAVWNTALEQRREYRRRGAWMNVDSKSRKSPAVVERTACGHRAHADVNAACDILNAAGHAVPACGDLGAGRSVKQEPPGPREAVPAPPAHPLVGIPWLSRGEDVNVVTSVTVRALAGWHHDE